MEYIQSELHVSLLKQKADYILLIVNFLLSVSRYIFYSLFFV